MLGLTAAGVAAAAVIPSALGIAVALAVAGAAQSVVMITRSLLLRAELPTDAHTAGFTTMYAVQGAGYALSAALASSVLGFATPPAAIGCGVLLMLVLSAASVVAEGLRTARGGGGRS
ncbi:MAG: hypothetical protein INR66_24615 [Gordonia polyisoprenivorans]|nr:hypothetical protein [Gordonia polyisoprenivorans]